jgi:hypothetical protein
MNRQFWLASTPLGTALRLSVAVLSLVLLIELVFFLIVKEPDNQEISASPLSFELLNPVRLAPLSAYEELVRRTLFSPDRKPKESVQQTTTEMTGKSSEHWLLVGVVKNGADSYAMFSEKQGQRHLKLEAGMLLDGWSVESISADQVVLIKDGERDTLRLVVSEPVRKPKRVDRKQVRSTPRAAPRTAPGIENETLQKIRAAQQKARQPRLVKPAEQNQADAP